MHACELFRSFFFAIVLLLFYLLGK